MIEHNKDIRTTENPQEIVDCVVNETYGSEPGLFIDFLTQLPAGNAYDFIRTVTVPYLFHYFEKNVLAEKNPLVAFPEELKGLREKLESLAFASNLFEIFLASSEESIDSEFENNVAKHTGQHYGQLFKEFSQESYFEEARKLLTLRLSRNAIAIPDLENKTLLDQGCGGGRYTAAWKLLGAGSCTGIDISEIGLSDADARVKIAGIQNVNYVLGSVLDMPFEDESFDIVFSNGVLHHTDNWQKGVAEQLRVMKDGGWGWQYLIENPGGLFWDMIEILRAVMKNVNKTYAQKVMRLLNISNNRIFYMLDHVMVPINSRLTPEELLGELERNGAKDIQRLTRGADFDRVEYIHKKVPYATEKFGVGENRFVFTK